MYLAWRDLWVARGRFALVGAVIALVALLAGLLSGLATGLVDDGISGLRRLPLTHLAFQDGAGADFSRSSLSPDLLTPWTTALGDDATPIGLSFFNARTPEGLTVDLALLGTPPGSFLARDQQADDALGERGLVLSEGFEQQGIKIGDQLTIVGPDVTLPVLGFTYGGSYGHVEIAFTSLDTWQHLVYGDDHRGRFNAIALTDTGGSDLSTLADETGMDVYTKSDAYGGSPGFDAESATMTLIRTFLVIISALVIGAFFTVWTVQRTHQIGLLKALGASTTYVVRDALGQLAIVITAATALGMAIAVGVGALISGGGIPFRLEPSSLLSSAALLAGVGMLGSLVALRRITRVDPAIALATQA
jgi:putative ABC transport system permease protein